MSRVILSESHRHKISVGVKKYYDEHPEKLEMLRRRSQDPDIRRKISVGVKRAIREGRLKNPMKTSPRARALASERMKRNNPAKRPEVREKLSRIRKKAFAEGRMIPNTIKPEVRAKLKGLNATAKHWAKILEVVEILKEEGFRCIPICRVIPDIVALKDNKLIAIEVEREKFKMPFDKYDSVDWFDEVRWYVFKEHDDEPKRWI